MEFKSKWLKQETEWLLIAVYPFLFLIASSASQPFWHFQAGIRCAALWSVRSKRWWLVALLEWTASATLLTFENRPPLSTVALIDLFVPFIVFALAHAAVFFFIRPNTTITNLRVLIGRIFAAIVAVALASFAFVNARQLIDQLEPQTFALVLLENRLGAWLGMITVGLLIVTLAHRTFMAGRNFDIRNVALSLLPAGVMFALMRFDPSYSHVDPLMIAILPLMLVSHHGGVRVAILSFNFLAIFVLLQHGNLPDTWQNGRVETFLILVGFGAVTIGGSADLTLSHLTSLSSTALAENERSSRMSDIALRLSHQEEKDRQRIAQDLHDQLGQDLTAIATYVQIASKRTEDLGTLQYLKTVSSLVDEAHWHLRAINDKLHPIALSRFGLVRALESGPVIELLTEQGFEYDFHSQGVDAQLPEKIEIALYRICQEAITNAIKHGKHRWLSVSLVQQTYSPELASLELRIHDDEGEIDYRNSTGYGIQGIRDRAHSIGALCDFNAENGTPRFILTVEFVPIAA